MLILKVLSHGALHGFGGLCCKDYFEAAQLNLVERISITSPE